MSRISRLCIGSLLLAGMVRPTPLLGADGVVPRFDRTAPRESLVRLVDDTERFVRAFEVLDPSLLASLQQARQRVIEAGDAELAAFEQLAPQLDRVMQVMAQVRAIVESPVPAVAPASVGFPEAAYPNVSWAFDLDAADGSDDPDDLPGGTGGAGDSGLCTSARQSDGTLFLLLNGTLLAEAVQMVASRVCDQVVVVVGGGNASLVCIITDLIYLAVRGANDNINYCEDQNDGAELHASYLRLGHLHTDLEAAEANLGLAITNTEIAINAHIDGAVTNLTNVVNASTAEIVNQIQVRANEILAVIQAGQDFTLRIEIEKALRSDTRLAVFYLPEAHGGKLSLVRTIVVETIQRVLDSGQGVTAAQARLATGDAKAAAGLYKEAFHYYAEAYYWAVRTFGDSQ
jgi:hypothetical protein